MAFIFGIAIGVVRSHPGCDFKAIVIKDNIIDCQGQPRSLLRSKES